MAQKQVGKPRRDAYGNIVTQHHLGNSDISRVVSPLFRYVH